MLPKTAREATHGEGLEAGKRAQNQVLRIALGVLRQVQRP